MRVLLCILKKEFSQIFKDKMILAMMFIMPTLQLIIMPLAANFEIKNITVAYVDKDHSLQSRDLQHKIYSSGYFKQTQTVDHFDQALEQLKKGQADVVVEIPVDFAQNIVKTRHTQINITIDAINGTKSSLGAAYLSQVIQDFNSGLAPKINNNMSTFTPSEAPITVNSWYNPRQQYKYFMVPAILVLLLTLIAGFLSALNIVKEKEMGTIEQINVSPIKKWQFILGKLIPFWIVGIVVFTIGLGVTALFYGITAKGSYALLYLFAAVYLIALLGIGLLISTLAQTQVQAMFIAFFFMMIFILMSGFFTSPDSMPFWARAISQATPVTHFIKVVRLIILKGSTLEQLYKELLYLLGFAVLLNTLAIWNYRKTN